MKIDISDILAVGELRQKFSKHYPFLRLEFFSTAAVEEIRPALRITDDAATLGSFRKKHNSGTLTIVPTDSTGNIERLFREHFGIMAQIFRRSGNTWILTTATDSLSLEKQNQLGKEMASAVPPAEPVDVEEMD